MMPATMTAPMMPSILIHTTAKLGHSLHMYSLSATKPFWHTAQSGDAISWPGAQPVQLSPSLSIEPMHMSPLPGHT